LKLLKDHYYSANDKIWDTWSDAEARAYLVKNKVVDKKQAAQAKRDQLEKWLEENYARLQWSIEEQRQVRTFSALVRVQWRLLMPCRFSGLLKTAISRRRLPIRRRMR
jgi:hypothetical protein